MKLHLKPEDLYPETYRLLAVHSSYPVYRLAFVLNKYLHIRLHYSVPVITTGNPKGFDVYECESPQGTQWILLQNTGFVEEAVSNFDLFSINNMGISKKVYYLESYKHIPYFLRIREEEDNSLNFNLSDILSNIPGIDYSEELEWEQFQSRDALLF
jgi:hypothetical protein